MRYTPEEIKIQKEALLKLLEPTMTIYTTIKHCSQSGMTRHIACYVAVIDDRTKQPTIRDISWYVANITDRKRATNGGVKIGGCGMDMGFALVYDLSQVLFPKGFKCLGDNCGANDHTNNYKCDRVKNKHYHRDGGYALNQEWL